MAVFKNLPDELVLMICFYVHRNDIKSFAHTNQNTRRVCQAKFAKQQELKAKWTVVSDEGKAYLSYSWFWHNLLHNILLGSPIADYITELRLGQIEDRRDTEETYGDESNHDWDTGLSRLGLDTPRRQSAQEKPLNFNPVLARMKFEEFVEPLYTENEKALLVRDWQSDFPRITDYSSYLLDFARTAVVLLLPNLQNLAFHYSSSEYNEVMESTITDAAIYMSRNPQGILFLPHLTTVTLGYGDGARAISESRFYNPWLLAAFLALPSVRTMKASNVLDHDYERLLGMPFSHATHLTLEYSELYVYSFSNLLKNGRPLESIALRNSSNRGFRSQFGEGLIKLSEVLATNARDSLEHLELLEYDREAVSRFPAHVHDCIQLQMFTNLKTVLISDDFLQLSPRPLYHLLPVSLEVFGLFSMCFTKQRLVAELLMLFGRKRVSLPALREVGLSTKFHSAYEWDERDTEALVAAGTAVGVLTRYHTGFYYEV